MTFSSSGQFGHDAFLRAYNDLPIPSDKRAAAVARWLDVSAPGFALVWDFGSGNAQDVSAVRLGSGALYAEWLETVTLQYSSDGMAWATLGSAAAAIRPVAINAKSLGVRIGFILSSLSAADGGIR